MKNMVDMIIPVYEPDKKLQTLIRRLSIQTVMPRHIYFLMTLTGRESDDEVRRCLERVENSSIISVKKEDFDHGGTRNLGAVVSNSEFMLFMTQDAVPADNELIESLLKAMEDKSVAVAYARQLPSSESGAIECFTREFNYPKESLVKSKSDLERLGIKTYFCSNVCALYRREIYNELGGFVTKTIFNEDMILAAKIIKAGYQISYRADARVIHAHHYTYRQQLKRNFDLAVSQCQYKEVFEGVKSENEGMRLVKSTCIHLLKSGRFYLLPDLFFQSAFKLIGYKLGLNYERLSKWVIYRCTMNKSYWHSEGERES